MTDVLVKPAFVSALPDTGDTTRLGPNAWNAARLFSAGALGDLLYRDTGSATGASYLPDVATGSVLVSGGVGAAPAWSAAPSLTNLTLSKSNGASQVVWAQHDPTISGTVGTAVGNVGGYIFGAMYQPVRFTNGPGGSENYIDDTWHIGQNLGTLSGGIGRADAAKPNLAISFESKFYTGAVFGQELHVQGVTADGLTTFRPLSVFAAHDGSVIAGTYSVDTFYINDKAGNALVQISDANNAMDFAGVKARFATNNVPAIQQINASGSFVNLLYLDAGNVANIATPLYVVATRAGAAAPFPGSFAVFQPTTANTNDIILTLAGPVITGNLSGVVARAQASALLQQEFNNQGAGDSRVLVAVEGAGDPTIKFDVSGGGRFSFGIDNSDSDKLKISTGFSVGSGDVVTILAAGNVGIGTASPNANAILDLTSTTMPFMPPRMTEAQRDAVASPTAGMVVYNSTTGKLNVRGASAWEAVTSA